MPLSIFRALRAIRAFEKRELPFLETLEDRDLVVEIGYHQAAGVPVTLKQLFLLDIGSVATVQRRLRRLRRLGMVQQRRSAKDARALELSLSPKLAKLCEQYAEALAR